jgi:hypothetical protein
MIKLFIAAPNYIIAFALCIGCTISAALSQNANLHWLIISDVNVALWLAVAYWFDPNKSRKGT